MIIKEQYGTEITFDSDNCVGAGTDGPISSTAVYIELQEGNDSESGYKNTTYSVYCDGSLVEGFENIEEPVIINSDGQVSSRYSGILDMSDETLYEKVVTTTDNLDNSVEVTYEIHMEYGG